MSDTQTATAIPTPAQDAYRDAKNSPALAAAREEFFAVETADLNRKTKDEVIALALQAEPWLQKSKVTTKEKAIRIVVRHGWEGTNYNKALEVLSETASVERRLMARSAQSAERLEMARTRLLEIAGDAWDAERTIDRVATLRQEAVAGQHWDEVLDYARTNAVGPVDALKVVFARVQKDMLYGRNHRVMSRSTSLSTNLVVDLDTEAKVGWMDDAHDLLIGL